MSNNSKFSRRTVMQGLAGAGALGVVSSPMAITKALAAGKVTIGFIYVGAKDDYGYNQAHADARWRTPPYQSSRAVVS